MVHESRLVYDAVTMCSGLRRESGVQRMYCVCMCA